MDRKERAELLRKAAQQRAARDLSRGEEPPEEPVVPQQSIRSEAVRADVVLEQAIARGDFDNLALAGKSLPSLEGNLDPDWWLKGLIQREQLSGLGPPALMLRKEDAELDSRLDRLGSERQVRETIEDFNTRVIEARRQLLGGPPVVTKTREVELEITRWRQRRRA
ncbi:hypothetical protein FHU41_002056 [Psychromicrobium silvestre]|uniref:DnaJ homologue subfamily C member 28 conserved domain-containing protein n=1 Tax=Psychromicrobium silvestre TaxID=1645614 RepID=A0A7Y9LUH0_9MICC|nr:DUF1992 domain-containing protein [Psychromicrobium silvestre]NYE95806.1 hypothetical protein [Psychromicrobium silvestre]